MIGIICAMAVEVEGLKSMMDNRLDLDYAKIKFTMGTIEGKDVVAAECGVGKVNAAMCAQLMIDKFNPDLIINSGVAGALTDDLTICDMVVGTEVLQHDMNASALGDPIGEIDFPDAKRIYFPCDEKIAEKIFKLCESIEDANAFKGRIASGDLFVSRRSKRERINIRFDAIACEMERRNRSRRFQKRRAVLRVQGYLRRPEQEPGYGFQGLLRYRKPQVDSCNLRLYQKPLTAAFVSVLTRY